LFFDNAPNATTNGGTLPIQIPNLLQWQGCVNRRTYLLAGFIGVAVKYNLDRLIATSFFHRSFNIASYWKPLGADARVGLIAL
jgi:hypothetical protein